MKTSLGARLVLCLARARVAASIALLIVTGCHGVAPHRAGPSSALEVKLNVAPSLGSCLRITIDGRERDVRSFDIDANHAASFSLGNVCASALRVWADAYPAACSRLDDATSATWFSESVSITTAAGTVTQVELSLQHDGQPRWQAEANRKAPREPSPAALPAAPTT